MSEDVKKSGAPCGPHVHAQRPVGGEFSRRGHRRASPPPHCRGAARPRLFKRPVAWPPKPPRAKVAREPMNSAAHPVRRRRRAWRAGQGRRRGRSPGSARRHHVERRGHAAPAFSSSVAGMTAPHRPPPGRRAPNRRVGPVSVSSRAAVSGGLPTSALARRCERASMGPEGGTPTAQAPRRPGNS